MLGLMAPTCLAVIAAVALGGSVRGLVSSSIRWWPAVLVAFAVELVLYNPPVNRQDWALTVGPWLWLATRSILLAAVLRNAVTARRPFDKLRTHAEAGRVSWGWWVAASGLALNSLVIALNGGYMPQSPEAASAVWGAAHFEPGRLYNVVPMGPSTQLAWLGDVFAEPRWLPRANVISAGDMLLALGLAGWVFGATARQGKLRTRIVGLSPLGAPTHGSARPSRRCST